MRGKWGDRAFVLPVLPWLNSAWDELKKPKLPWFEREGNDKMVGSRISLLPGKIALQSKDIAPHAFDF